MAVETVQASLLTGIVKGHCVVWMHFVQIVYVVEE